MQALKNYSTKYCLLFPISPCHKLIMTVEFFNPRDQNLFWSDTKHKTAPTCTTSPFNFSNSLGFGPFIARWTTRWHMRESHFSVLCSFTWRSIVFAYIIALLLTKSLFILNQAKVLNKISVMLTCTKIAQIQNLKNSAHTHTREKSSKAYSKRPLMKVITQLWTSGADPLSMEESEQTMGNLCKGICRWVRKITSVITHL